MRLLADARLRITPSQGKAALGGVDEACDQAQQAGFARAVGTGYQQRSAGADLEIKPFEDREPCPRAGQVGSREEHHGAASPEESIARRRTAATSNMRSAIQATIVGVAAH